jgi:hypothetical protein
VKEILDAVITKDWIRKTGTLPQDEAQRHR